MNEASAAPRKPSVVLLGPARGAMGGVTTHLNQMLASELARDIDLHYFSIGGEGRSESGLRRAWRLAVSPWRLLIYLLVHRPDIVHLNTSLNSKAYWRDVAYLLVAKLLRRKVVYQVHGGALPVDFFRGRPFLTRLLRWILPLPDAVVLLAQVEMTAYREFAPAARLFLIPNAIDVSSLPGYSAKPQRDHLQLAYVGRLERTKGIYEVIAAMAILRERGVHVRFSVAGGGPEECGMREAVARSGLDGSIDFLGPLFGEAKNRLWLDADVFVFPTYHREGLPYAVLESMAACAVAVTSPAGAIPDVIQHGVHGILVPAQNPPALADALQELHRDRVQLERLASAGRQRIIEHYALPRLVRDFKQLYRSL